MSEQQPNEGQSIQEFFNSRFSEVTQDKKSLWIRCLADEGYETVQELQSNSEQAWSKLSSKLQSGVVEDIREKLRSVSNEKGEIVQIETENMLESNQQSLIFDLDLNKITELLDQDFPPQKIVKLMNAELGKPSGFAVLQKIKSLIEPSKPYPSISRSVAHRQTSDPTLPLYLYESQKIDERKYYTFLIIGETGSGKTTLLDAFVNKLTGMKLTDNWRWKLADQSHLNSKENKVSKTSQISYYYINDCLNKFNMLIIDTPGFGDTRGTHVDDEITNKFKTFFYEIKQIDYILWTIKSSDTRELSGSLYIYDRIMELFGNNVKDKFIIMCTFADDQIPKCLQILKGIICYQTYFKFNNSALYIPYENSSSMTKYYWQMGMSCIDKFISYIQTENVQPFSLQQSIEVLEIRKQITQLISDDKMIIFQSLFKISRQYLQELRKNIQKVYSNTPYKTAVPYTQYRRTPLSNFYQMCQICQISCCQSCVWPSGSYESKCVHINPYCQVCPGRCPRSSHMRLNQRIQKYTNYREQIVNYKKFQFDRGYSYARSNVEVLRVYTQKIAEASTNVWQNALKIKQHLKKLEAIALKPKFLGNEQFYKKMIIQQQQNKRIGRQDRIKKLQQTIDNIKYIEKVQKSNRVYDLLPGYEQFQNDFNSLSKQYDGIRP